MSRPRVQSLTFFFFFCQFLHRYLQMPLAPLGLHICGYLCVKNNEMWALEDQVVAVKTCPVLWFNGLSGCAHSETITAPTTVYMQGQLLPFASVRHHPSWEKLWPEGSGLV